MINKIFFLIILLVFSSKTFAAESIKQTNYFAALRSDETNVRAGPGINYPVKFMLKLKMMPVRVISEYDNWSEIEDFEGQSGWVNQNLLTKKRSLMVYTGKPFINMYAKNNTKSNIIFRLENYVVGSHIKCIEGWCAVKIENKKGWLEKRDLWGN